MTNFNMNGVHVSAARWVRGEVSTSRWLGSIFRRSGAEDSITRGPGINIRWPSNIIRRLTWK